MCDPPSVQVPVSLLEYGGSPAAHLALHLYSQGAGASYRASDDVPDGGFRCQVRGCDGHGKLGKLIQRLLSVDDFDAVKDFIKEVQNAVVLAGV